jgi:hypothetical protein
LRGRGVSGPDALVGEYRAANRYGAGIPALNLVLYGSSNANLRFGKRRLLARECERGNGEGEWKCDGTRWWHGYRYPF